MTFVARLRAQRPLAGDLAPAPANTETKVAGGVAPADVVEAPHAGAAGTAPPAEAKKRVSNAFFRRTTEDLFASADALGIPAALVARHAVGLDREAAGMDRLGQTLEETWA